ncbi:hypothetical protein ILUMI_01514 [Ignelater luminosus]|uniref:Peptidase A2 domain-containing protein n=1 Tax=Ignelater luminosus TaxID=2038154 RepID=A0A8K0DF73_IGNLU|nr:hypothetical protein ILUMI_01514 [Ignelater luminosus]
MLKSLSVTVVLVVFVNTIRVNNVHHKQNHVWHEIVNTENRKIKIKVNTGADVSIMPLKVFKKLDSQLQKIKPTNYVLKAFEGSTLKPTGVVRLHCNYKSNELYENFMIIEHAEQVLLGGWASLQLQLVTRINSNIANDNVKTRVINENSDIFTGNGKFPGQCCITVLDKFEPVCHPTTKAPIAIGSSLKKELDRLVERKAIVKVGNFNPKASINKMVMVEKPNGNLRLCLDPLDLNTDIVRKPK